MPYILENEVDAALKKALNAGGLNCALSYAVADFVMARGLRYYVLNAARAALERAKFDFMLILVHKCQCDRDAKTERLDVIGMELYIKLNGLIQEYLYPHGLTQRYIFEVVGALCCCADEFYRRVVAPYEDTKIGNGSDAEGRCDPYKDLVEKIK